MQDGKIGFIFDLDGTLLDSTDIGLHVQDRVIEVFDLEITPSIQAKADTIVRQMIKGKSSKNLAIKIIWNVFKAYGLGLWKRLKALKIAKQVYEEWKDNIDLIEGAEDVIEFLEKNHIPYAVATTSSKEEVDAHLLNNHPHFYNKIQERLITRDMVKNMKPNPESIQKASQLIGNIPLSKLVMVGDLHIDILMGKAVNAVTIGVLSGFFQREDFDELETDFVLSSVAEIPSMITEIKEKIKKNN